MNDDLKDKLLEAFELLTNNFLLEIDFDHENYHMYYNDDKFIFSIKSGCINYNGNVKIFLKGEEYKDMVAKIQKYHFEKYSQKLNKIIKSVRKDKIKKIKTKNEL